MKGGSRDGPWEPVSPGDIVGDSTWIKADGAWSFTWHRVGMCPNSAETYSARNLLLHIGVFPEPEVSDGIFIELEEGEIQVCEGPGCEHKDHCGVASPVAAGVPVETGIEDGDITFFRTEVSPDGTTVFTNDSKSFSPLGTWALVGPQVGVLNLIDSGQSATYTPGGIFTMVEQGSWGQIKSLFR